MEKEIYEFLSNNLRLDIDDNCSVDYGRSFRELTIRLLLKNPETGCEETLSSHQVSIE